MTSRRAFLKKAAIGSGLLLSGTFPFESFCMPGEKLTILHTNDTHSRLQPFITPALEGMGGIANRAHIIAQIRKETEHVLLLDASDFIQGHPAMYHRKGRDEIMAMNALQYDAATIGDHDFDIGVEGFAQIASAASFPLLTANYDFRNSPMEGKTKPYAVLHKAGYHIGVFGLGVQLKGLLNKEEEKRIRYTDPLRAAKEISQILKREELCDMIICLSHLGFAYGDARMSDKILAAETEYIDLIIGGHTHTFLDKPYAQHNKLGKIVVVNQAGWGGLILGRLDYIFDSKKSSKLFNTQSVIVSKQTIE